ncbi:MAG: DUF1003 domain-containing protein [Candidatus Babeliales bacterium]
MSRMGHNWHQRHLQEHHHNLGGRLADCIAQALGSWKFIILQAIILCAWVILNVSALVFKWDEYPFVLLNLLLATQAAFTAPIIMMSQNRQAARDRTQAEHDYEVNENSLKLININNDLTAEIHKLTHEIHALTRNVHELIKAHKE